MRKVVSIRLEEEIKKDLKDKFGTVQGAIDIALEEFTKDFFYIYKVTNRRTYKSYVGISDNPKKRWAAHCAASTPLGRDIRNNGRAAFNLTVLAKVDNRDMALELERIFIDYFNTEEAGYNRKVGRKKDGKQVKVVKTVRLEPSVKKKIDDQYGSFSAFIKAAIAKLL